VGVLLLGAGRPERRKQRKGLAVMVGGVKDLLGSGKWGVRTRSGPKTVANRNLGRRLRAWDRRGIARESIIEEGIRSAGLREDR